MDKTCLLIVALGAFFVLVMAGLAIFDHIQRADKVEVRAPLLTVRSEHI
jgi:hypothetical protein